MNLRHILKLRQGFLGVSPSDVPELHLLCKVAHIRGHLFTIPHNERTVGAWVVVSWALDPSRLRAGTASTYPYVVTLQEVFLETGAPRRYQALCDLEELANVQTCGRVPIGALRGARSLLTVGGRGVSRRMARYLIPYRFQAPAAPYPLLSENLPAV